MHEGSQVRLTPRKNMKVIIATDGSIESDISRSVLKRLPFPKDADFTVAMVTQLPAMAAIGLAPMTIETGERYASSERQTRIDSAQQVTDRVSEELKRNGFVAEGLVLEGDASNELLTLVKSQPSDLVVAGCGGNSAFATFFLGSVSRQLVLYSEASILIGRQGKGNTAEGTFSKLEAKGKLDLVLAVDGSKGSELAIQTLAQLDTPVFGSIYVVCVEPMDISPSVTDVSTVLPHYQADKARIEGIASEAAAKIAKAAAKVEIVGAFGRPSVEICKVAGEKEADLIMLGANRHGFLERLIVGSCAYETAISAPCSVMILRGVLDFAVKA
jgi:nucleotide-binding universal stress UspA family protein